ncbi:hypothetical protein HaLaN_06078 [Haematococcus lacustris]|uniref:Uncharacterized protein n=1 Tax=Haematococcus lacustris TaxID=44745 RepID=A0A699YUQ5_HAELA|nr:hypothetical protein HaLaN_06078 [Haematococcus lacustris]
MASSSARAAGVADAVQLSLMLVPHVHCPDQVIKVPEGAVLRGCKKTRRKLREHLRLRAEGAPPATG